MSTSTIANIEYITAHPLIWSKDVREYLKVEIVDGPGCLAAQRSLSGDISVNLSGLEVVGRSMKSLKYDGLGGFLYECIDSVKSSNGRPLDVSFSPNPIELKRLTDSVLIPAKHYNYCGITFLAFVTPDDVRRARWALRTFEEGTFDITSYYLAVLIALSQQAVKFLGKKRDAYPVNDPPFPLSHGVGRLMYPGMCCLSNRGRQGNHCLNCPSSNLLPRQIRTGY